MKNILLEIINSDASYNKSATKMLRTTHPELWDEVLQITSFLPNDAKPKQRVWHILNDCFIRPVCPITQEYVKWREKKYDKYSSVEAKNKDIGNILSKSIAGENHWRKKDPEKAHTANKKYSSGLANGRIVVDRSKRNQADILAKTKQTCLEKYGVDNPSKALFARKKISDASVRNGATPRSLRSLRDLYYASVKRFTEESWKNCFDKINPTRLNRSQVDVDHIYSIQQGFRNSIPAYIIGHWSNLRMLPKGENYSKGKRCDKTQDQLFEDFFKSMQLTQQ